MYTHTHVYMHIYDIFYFNEQVTYGVLELSLSTV